MYLPCSICGIILTILNKSFLSLTFPVSRTDDGQDAATF